MGPLKDSKAFKVPRIVLRRRMLILKDFTMAASIMVSCVCFTLENISTSGPLFPYASVPKVGDI
jgi:hypothetical protein